VLFEACMVDAPAEHRSEDGPAPRHTRLAAVPRLSCGAHCSPNLDVRATVLRPKSIDKLTSALAIFGELVCDLDPTCAASPTLSDATSKRS